MARKLREFGRSGIYHVMLRGINKQRIFEWKEDYSIFLDILQKTLTTTNEGQTDQVPNYKIHAYCLMDNHVHLLIGVIPGRLSLPEIVKRITTRYAQRFNLRYNRVGHLFQDRYRSEPCDDERYFFQLMDYIHNNPVKASVCRHPEQYPYSSFCELTGKPSTYHLCTTEVEVLDIQPKEIPDWLSGLALPEKEESMVHRIMSKLFPLIQAKNEQLDPYQYEELIANTLLDLTDTSSISEFQQLDKATMRAALAQVRDTGVSVKCLSRLTGISDGIIRHCKNPNDLII